MFIFKMMQVLKKRKRLVLAGQLLFFMMASSHAWAHGGAIEISNTGNKGPVHLTVKQAQALDLKTVVADTKPIAELLPLNGEVRLLPNLQADISTRISGQISEVYVNLGDAVKSGQALAKIQSRLVGDPPPSIIINSPMNGLIDERNISLGQAIEPNTVLFHVSDRHRMQIVARIYEEDLEKVHIDQGAVIRVLGYKQAAFNGKVSRLDPNLDQLTRTSQLWVEVDNAQGLLKPNMFAKVNIILKENAAVLAIPYDAMMEANGEKFVFVKEGDDYRRVELKVGATDGRNIEVQDGLVPGDLIVTQGNRELYTLWLTGGQMKAED